MFVSLFSSSPLTACLPACLSSSHMQLLYSTIDFSFPYLFLLLLLHFIDFFLILQKKRKEEREGEGEEKSFGIYKGEAHE